MALTVDKRYHWAGSSEAIFSQTPIFLSVVWIHITFAQTTSDNCLGETSRHSKSWRLSARHSPATHPHPPINSLHLAVWLLAAAATPVPYFNSCAGSSFQSQNTHTYHEVATAPVC